MKLTLSFLAGAATMLAALLWIANHEVDDA